MFIPLHYYYLQYLVGGVRHKEQTFNKLQTHTGSGLLLLAIICMLLPAVLDATNTEAVDNVSSTLLSRVVSIIMVVTYGALMVFQLKTHADLFDALEAEPEPIADAEVGSGNKGDPLLSAQTGGNRSAGHSVTEPERRMSETAALSGTGITALVYRPTRASVAAVSDLTGLDAAIDGMSAATGEAEEPPLSLASAVFWLVVIAAFIAGLSELLTTSIEDFARLTNIPDAFVSTILLPIAGNVSTSLSHS